MPADGRVVLVTGGASGLGAAIVSALGAAGATAVCLDLHAPAGGCDYEQVEADRRRTGGAERRDDRRAEARRAARDEHAAEVNGHGSPPSR